MMQSLEEEIKSTTGGARRKSDEKTKKGESGNPSLEKPKSSILKMKSLRLNKSKEHDKHKNLLQSEIKKLDEEYKRKKTEYERQHVVLDQRIQEKTFIHQSKYQCLVARIELQNVISYEQNIIKEILKTYNTRHDVIGEQLDGLSASITSIKSIMSTLDNEILELSKEAKNIHEAYENYTNSYLKLKTALLKRKKEEQNVQDNKEEDDDKSNSDENEMLNIKEYIADLQVCKICFSEISKVYCCSNGHIVCHECKEQCSSCAYCREKSITRSLVIEEIIQKGKQRKGRQEN